MYNIKKETFAEVDAGFVHKTGETVDVRLARGDTSAQCQLN